MATPRVGGLLQQLDELIVTTAEMLCYVPAQTLFGNEKAKPLATVTVPLAMGTSYESFLSGIRPLRRR